MAGTAIIHLMTLAIASDPAPQDCRAIADSAARLACYDARDRAAPTPTPAPAPAPMAAAPTAPPAAPTAAPVSVAESVRANPAGRIVSVEVLPYGYHRVRLADGRAFDTATNTAPPPVTGDEVTLRRSVIGTTFLDIRGRKPITVRLVRPQG
jgi:hypothetical protein